MSIETTDIEENLALRPGVLITVSQPHPFGGGSRDPRVLLNESALLLDGHPLADFDRINTTYDTYHGQNPGTGYDWYALEFPQPVTLNCVEMTMGYPHYDGGWWTSLTLEVRAPGSVNWEPVEQVEITPPYRFENAPEGRRPFETYVFTFSALQADALRIIGQPGGIAQLTSLARIAVYYRDFSRWNPLRLINPPIPHVFRLIPPNLAFDLAENLAEVTGLHVGIPMNEYYVDAQRYQRFWRRILRDYSGEPDLAFVLGENIGWHIWNHLPTEIATDVPPGTANTPHVRQLFDLVMACAVAPVVIDNQIIGEVRTSYALVKEHFDWQWHQQKARELDVPWEQYRAAVERTAQMTQRQLQSMAELLGMIANTIVTLVHRLENTEDEENKRKQGRKATVRRAIDYMEEHLEEGVTVGQVAQDVHLTMPYFSTLFTEEMGQHPSDYLISLRIERAREYFTHTTLSVVEVSHKLGYDASYFSRLFKRHTGYAPSHFSSLKRAGHV